MVKGICDFAICDLWYVICDIDMWLLIIRYPAVKFDSHGSRAKWIYNIFRLLYDFMWPHDQQQQAMRLCGYKPTLGPTTLSSLIAIGLTEVEM